MLFLEDKVRLSLVAKKDKNTFMLCVYLLSPVCMGCHAAEGLLPSLTRQPKLRIMPHSQPNSGVESGCAIYATWFHLLCGGA